MVGRAPFQRDHGVRPFMMPLPHNYAMYHALGRPSGPCTTTRRVAFPTFLGRNALASDAAPTIKTANKPDYERAEALAAALVSAVALDERRQVEHIYRTAEKRAQHLTAEAVRFIATAEHVARQLRSDPQLEWSPAVIGLCKAVESEVLHRILIPLANRAGHAELDADKTDKDLRRVAGFCAKPSRKPPELGVFAHFLQTVIHSQQRRGTSAIIQSFLGLASDWTGSDWILNPGSFHRSLVTLTTDYRNRAAHVDELAKSDYLGCRDLAIGSSGIIWRLIVATERHR